MSLLTLDMPDRALASANGRSCSFARPSAVRCACGNSATAARNSAAATFASPWFDPGAAKVSPKSSIGVSRVNPPACGQPNWGSPL